MKKMGRPQKIRIKDINLTPRKTSKLIPGKKLQNQELTLSEFADVLKEKWKQPSPSDIEEGRKYYLLRFTIWVLYWKYLANKSNPLTLNNRNFIKLKRILKLSRGMRNKTITQTRAYIDKNQTQFQTLIDIGPWQRPKFFKSNICDSELRHFELNEETYDTFIEIIENLKELLLRPEKNFFLLSKFFVTPDRNGSKSIANLDLYLTPILREFSKIEPGLDLTKLSKIIKNRSIYL